MKLRNRKFEKVMRRRVRAELRKSPSNWREYRRVRRRWRDYQIPNGLSRLFILCILVPMAAFNFRSLGAFVGLAVFWTIASMMIRTGQLLIALRSSARLPLLAHLPVSNEQAFTYLWRSFLKVSLWTFVDFTAIYFVLALRSGAGVNSIWTGLTLALAQWLGIVACAVCFVTYVPARKFRPVGALLAIPIIASLIGGPSIQSMAEWLGRLGYWLPPMGWILYAWGISRETGLPGNLWPAFSMAVMLFLLPLAYRRLRHDYVLPEVAPDAEAKRGVVEAERRVRADGTDPDPFVELKAAIRRREFLAGFDWQRAGWLERFTARWLTPSQRLTAEFLTAANPRWTRATVWLVLISCGLAVLIYVFPRAVQAVSPIAFGLVFFAANFLVKDWPGTALRRVAGSHSGMHSVYPVGFWQIAAVIIKTNLVRTLAAAPFLAILGVVVTMASGYAPLEGIFKVLKVFTVIAAVHFFLPIVPLSPGTNDTKRPGLVLLFVTFIFILLAACLTLFLAGPPGVIVAAVFLIGGSAGVLLLYGSAYNHNWFDLQNKPNDNKTMASQ